MTIIGTNLIADGGKEEIGGWCKDKLGLSWQVVPTILGELMSNPENGQRVVQAFMKCENLILKHFKMHKTMKRNKIIYWISTGFFCAFLLLTSISYFTDPKFVDIYQHLGFPQYFRVELGIAKILGVL